MQYTLGIVEDEYVIRTGLQYAMPWDDMGFQVVFASASGTDGMAKAIQYKPDCMLVDIRIPGMDGLEMITRLQEQGLDTIFVILSGYSDFKYAQKAISLKVFEYLLKPTSDEEIEETFFRIHQALDRRYAQPSNMVEDELLRNLCCCTNVMENTRLSTQYFRILHSHWMVLWAASPLEQSERLEVLRLETAEGRFRCMGRFLDRGGEAFIFAGANTLIEDLKKEMSKTDLLTSAEWHFGTPISRPGLLFESYRSIQSPESTVEPNNIMPEMILQYLEENLEKNLTLGDVAAHFYMNGSYLSTYFKKKTGKNLFDALAELRILRAQALLKNSNMLVYEVSERAGYPNYRNFCKVFKRFLGVTPTEYREKNHEKE